ncbi:glycerate kinase [Candidatus Dependentiae bacterium]|nr:glycerate kinase [Candidatus Dependentiae bacterium]
MYKNSNILIKTRKDAFKIIDYAIEKSSVESVFEQCIDLTKDQFCVNGKIYGLNKYKNIYVIGFGKASAAMAVSLENILGNYITAGYVITKYGHSRKTEKIKIVEAGHPIPDKNGIKHTKQLAEFLKKSDKDDLVICLLSGGGSSLLIYPEDNVTLEDKQKITAMLLACGAEIKEINTIRKYLSKVKGGGLLNYIYPAECLSLIVSDVIGNDLETIASGPTVFQSKVSNSDCLTIFKKYNLLNKIFSNKKLKKLFTENFNKTAVNYHPKIENIILINNQITLAAAKKKAESLNYNTIILSSEICGDTTESANFHYAIAKEIFYNNQPLQKPACIISGGETIVKLKGNGKGGRNQEFTLAAVLNIQNKERITIASIGTDGTDGPTDAAGAIADYQTLKRAKSLNLNPSKFLNSNDSYTFFKKLNDLIITGPTGINVMDLRLFLIY